MDESVCGIMYMLLCNQKYLKSERERKCQTEWVTESKVMILMLLVWTEVQRCDFKDLFQLIQYYLS